MKVTRDGRPCGPPTGDALRLVDMAISFSPQNLGSGWVSPNARDATPGADRQISGDYTHIQKPRTAAQTERRSGVIHCPAGF
jgi:hypothetical protein